MHANGTKKTSEDKNTEPISSLLTSGIYMEQHNNGETSDIENNQMVDYMLHDSTVHINNQEHDDQDRPYHHVSSSFCNSTSSLDKLNFQDVMQFADFGPKLSVNQQPKNLPADEATAGIDPIFFLKFPVLNHHQQENDEDEGDLMFGSTRERGRGDEINVHEDETRVVVSSENEGVRFVGENMEKNEMIIREELQQQVNNKINKKKRARSIKTSEEVESQRMTHIAVERNRRKQMNEHLRVLRSLMPASYVQRGDQASIIGGAIEFVRELEQLLQCLESQKRRRLYGDGVGTTPIGPSSVLADQDHHLPFFPAIPPPHDGQLQETGISSEEIAESKSCIADIEVKLLGFDAMIKILSRRRPGQLVKAIAALEDLQINILHTNITTIDQTVLYSFTVKVGGEARLTAEDIANSVQQIFTFIHAYDSI